MARNDSRSDDRSRHRHGVFGGSVVSGGLLVLPVLAIDLHPWCLAEQTGKGMDYQDSLELARGWSRRRKSIVRMEANELEQGPKTSSRIGTC